MVVETKAGRAREAVDGDALEIEAAVAVVWEAAGYVGVGDAMKRHLPVIISILANFGGGAIGIGIAYFLGPFVPAVGDEARPVDGGFLQAFLLGWAVPSVIMPLLIGPYPAYRRFGPAGVKGP